MHFEGVGYHIAIRPRKQTTNMTAYAVAWLALNMATIDAEAGNVGLVSIDVYDADGRAATMYLDQELLGQYQRDEIGPFELGQKVLNTTTVREGRR